MYNTSSIESGSRSINTSPLSNTCRGWSPSPGWSRCRGRGSGPASCQTPDSDCGAGTSWSSSSHVSPERMRISPVSRVPRMRISESRVPASGRPARCSGGGRGLTWGSAPAQVELTLIKCNDNVAKNLFM